MNTTLAVVGALGGLTAFGAAVWAIVRAITGQVTATKDNTKALNELKDTIKEMDGRIDGQETRIARLEGWRQRD